MFLLFQLLDLLLEALDDLLAEMRAFREFLLNLFVNLDIAFERLNLSLHLVVLEEQLLSLLRLVLKLSRQLVVLENG